MLSFVQSLKHAQRAHSACRTIIYGAHCTVIPGGKLTINLFKKKWKKKVSPFILVQIVGVWVPTWFQVRKNSTWSADIYNTAGECALKGGNIAWPGARPLLPDQVARVSKRVSHPPQQKSVFPEPFLWALTQNLCSLLSFRKELGGPWEGKPFLRKLYGFHISISALSKSSLVSEHRLHVATSLSKDF